MGKKQILIVDDDENLSASLKDYLELESYVVTAVNSADDALAFLSSNKFDLVVVDYLMPDVQGFEFLRTVQKDHSMPVLMMSGRGQPEDRIAGLEAGADDYIAKPFLPRELSARINALLRRENSAADNNKPQSGDGGGGTLAFGPWILDSSKMDALDENGKKAGLTPGEFQLLYALAESKGRIMSRAHLFDKFHDYDSEAFDRAIDIQITRIRTKIGDSAKEPRYIKTIRGVGYMFMDEEE